MSLRCYTEREPGEWRTGAIPVKFNDLSLARELMVNGINLLYVSRFLFVLKHDCCDLGEIRTNSDGELN